MRRVPDVWSPARQEVLRRFLVAALGVVVLAAALAAVLPDEAGAVAGGVMVGALVAVPLLRVAWLGLRWLRRGDARFALVAAGLLAIVAVGATVALLRR